MTMEIEVTFLFIKEKDMIDKKLILICAACFLPSLCGSTELTHQISQAGSSASNVGSHATFTGKVRHDSISRPDADSPYSVSYVTFEPGARTFWHTHPAGQRMLIVFGKGLIGDENGNVHVVRPGDNVWCPPGLKHWHGAAPDTAMVHMVITNMKGGKNVTWMEEVSDKDYTVTPSNK